MRTELFRQQVLLARANTQFGSAVFHQPLSVRLLVLGVLLGFLVFISFAALADFKQTERVRGYLTSISGELKLYSSRAGIFQQIHHSEGQKVRAGEVIATISEAQTDVSGRQHTQVLLTHLEQQIAQYRQRVTLLKNQSVFVSTQLQERIVSTEAELLLLREEHAIIKQRLELSEQELSGSQILLERGSIAGREHNQMKTNWYSLLQLSKNAEVGLQSKMLALQEARHQLKIQPLQYEDELLLLNSSISQLQARSSELQTQGLFTLTAPDTGVISNLLARAGDYADPRIPVLTLVPADYVLEAMLYLPSRALGKVETGQEVMLAYDAYPYQTYGTFVAHITQISTAVMDPREHLFPVELSEPVYLVKAAIAQQSVAAAGAKKLQPGMQFSAEIITGNESVLQRLLSPFSSLRRKL